MTDDRMGGVRRLCKKIFSIYAAEASTARKSSNQQQKVAPCNKTGKEYDSQVLEEESPHLRLSHKEVRHIISARLDEKSSSTRCPFLSLSESRLRPMGCGWEGWVSLGTVTRRLAGRVSRALAYCWEPTHPRRPEPRCSLQCSLQGREPPVKLEGQAGLLPCRHTKDKATRRGNRADTSQPHRWLFTSVRLREAK